MTAPLVTARDGHVLLIPQDVSLDELAEAVHEWEAARDYRQALWDNRTRTGPDYTQAENIETSRADDVRDLIAKWMRMEPREAFQFGVTVSGRADQADRELRARIDRHSADCPACKAERSAS